METLISILTGDCKAIAIDPSYISKFEKNTPLIGYFWSSAADQFRCLVLQRWEKPKMFFSTNSKMSGKDFIENYRTHFQIEFCFSDANGIKELI